MFCSVSRAAARLSAPTDSSRPLSNQQHDKFLVSSPRLIRQKLERGNEHIKSRKEARPGSEGERTTWTRTVMKNISGRFLRRPWLIRPKRTGENLSGKPCQSDLESIAPYWKIHHDYSTSRIQNGTRQITNPADCARSDENNSPARYFLDLWTTISRTNSEGELKARVRRSEKTTSRARNTSLR